MAVHTAPILNIYDLQHYKFEEKESLLSKDTSYSERVIRLAKKFEQDGIRRSVEAILLVHKSDHPHVFIFQNEEKKFFLPGGRLRVGESERDGLKRKLRNKLQPSLLQHDAIEWEIMDQVGLWWRPNFSETTFPYIPPHITKPKEQIVQYLVKLPEKCTLAAPQNYKLVAVPLFDLYDNNQRWGPRLAALPQMLARMDIRCIPADPKQSDNMMEM